MYIIGSFNLNNINPDLRIIKTKIMLLISLLQQDIYRWNFIQLNKSLSNH